MKIVRYEDPAGNLAFGEWKADGRVTRLRGNYQDGLAGLEETAPVSRILIPVKPTTIFCLGLNYRQHAEEAGREIPEWPVLFMKSPSAVQHPEAPILLPTHLASDSVDYEGELAVVIGKAGKNIPRQRALEHVLGYTCANDVSARDWQLARNAGQWCRGKTFDTFCPLGPCLVTPDEIPDPGNLDILTRLNGEVVQKSNTADMIFSVAETISFLSGSTTLLPGTVILTGTPQGVGMAYDPPRYLKPGDKVEVEIEGIGILSNPVASE